LFIYKIEGNTLTLTGSEPGIDYRPVTFGESGDSRTYTGPLHDTNDDDSGGGGGGCFLETLNY